MDKIKKIEETLCETALDCAVAEIINDHIREDDYDLALYMQDLMRGGCQSGFVSELIYYSDTEDFYKAHIDDIGKLLSDTIAGIGNDIVDVFGDKWDKTDPLATQQENRNLLAWFAFEETARNLAAKMGVEV
jgi:hypothetical protein